MVYSSCMKLFSRWSTKHHNGGDSKGEWYSDSRVHTTPSLLDIDEQHYGDQQVTQHPAQELLLAQGSCFLDRMHHPTMVMESMQDLTLSCLHSFYIKFPIFYCMTTCFRFWERFTRKPHNPSRQLKPSKNTNLLDSFVCNNMSLCYSFDVGLCNLH